MEGQLTVYLSRHIRSNLSKPQAVYHDFSNGDQEEGTAVKRQLLMDEKEEMERVPCFRCIHPIPAPANAVQGCSDAGVIGVGKSFI